MPPFSAKDLSRDFPRTWAHLPDEARQELRRICGDPEDLPHLLQSRVSRYGLPEFLPQMADLEREVTACRRHGADVVKHPSKLGLNPSLSLVQVQWKGLIRLVDPERGEPPEASGGRDLVREERTVLVWWDPFRRRVRLEAASSEDLLAMKMVAEGMDARDLASEHGLQPSLLYSFLQRSRRKGLLLGPPSGLQRPPEVAAGENSLAETHRTAEIFTLQWHLTDACDMRCRHCYGGGEAKQSMDKGVALRVLREMSDFCRQKNVRGRIAFSGGNPLLHPDFFELYQAAVREGFLVTILGNPTDDRTLERLLAIQPPAVFQVSLEGLREHNDAVRQAGHYDRVLGFLDRLRKHGVPSQVMLTLTRANMGQVLPLGGVLRERADRFTYNRISLVGSGASLQPPDTKAYASFLGDYLEAARDNPVLRLKDNLLNPALAAQGEEPFGGCTGFGCGAAFNFAALLPDGQVYACRKFPSPLGNIHDQSLTEIYDSPVAAAYRRAPEDCLGCPLGPVCRGCPAVVHSFGGNVFRDRDPYCPGRFESTDN